jgi:hypothetical protein
MSSRTLLIMLYSAALVASAPMARAQPQANPVGNAQSEVDRAFYGALARLGLIPITVPRGQSVGDVYGPPPLLTLVARSSNCFPSLRVENAPSEIPSIEFGAKTDIGAVLGIGDGAIQAKLDVNNITRTVMHFSSVRAYRASELDFHSHLDKNSCKFLLPLFSGQVPTDRFDMPILVAETFTAIRELEVEVKSGEGGQVSTTGLEKFLAKFGTPFSVSGSAESASTQKIVIRGLDPVVVAIRTAFLPVERITGLSMGAAPPGQIRRELRLQWFDPELPSEQAAFEDWIGQHVH